MEEPWKDPVAAAYRGRAAYLQDYLAAPRELPLVFTTCANSTSSAVAFSSSPDTSSRRDAAGGAGDLRMVRHRASARKHAYTKELERELARLRRDNHMLIKRLQDLLLHVPAQVPTLRRCRSAPPAP